MTHRTITSPVGELLLTASEQGLTGVWFEQHAHAPSDVLDLVGANGSADLNRAGRPASDSNAAPRRSRAERTLDRAAAQLAEYFDGRRTTFDLPLAPVGTEFQMQVWNELRSIPFGEAISYAELARRIGNARAVRAVGSANGRNPLSIVVPCHRVIGADGSLTGFGGGVERKRWLLEHEHALGTAQGALFAPGAGAGAGAGAGVGA